ncbi:MAG TPA: Mur ligase family protein [Thermomicrobiales bacterium]|nr:Mur ligase family protein [Thermomicrobiales bacterium]
MIVADPVVPVDSEVTLVHPTFRSWQRDTYRSQLLQVVGISGTRGKSTVLRLVEAMIDQSHLHCATWTDMGVQIRGRRQRGELAGWSHALTRLSEGSVDIALQELDWNTVNAVGLPPESYPVMAITGLRERTENDDKSPSLQSAIRGAQRIVAAVPHSGFIVVNADDYYAVEAVADTDATVLQVARSHLSPNLVAHLEDGGSGVWVREGTIMVGDASRALRLCRVTDVPLTMRGEASFNITNVLLAIAIGRGIGIDMPSIIRTIRTFRSAWAILPASMNTYDGGHYLAAIDQLGPPWVLQPVLRAVNPSAERRQVTVIGDLRWIDAEEVHELGRLLGRYHGAIVLHSDQDEALVEQFRQGLAANQYPPLFIRLPTERRAINRAFKAIREDDVLLILTTGDSAAAHRAVRRHIA